MHSLINQFFPDGDPEAILRILSAYGTESYEREVERVRRAVLKLSEGDIKKLKYFVEVAKKDYRDVLMWSEEPPDPTESKQMLMTLLRQTFNESADLYDKWRPGYPNQLYDDIVAISKIPAHGKVLEVGCGTGQATRVFLKRDFNVTAVELGHNLAEYTRDKLTDFANLKIITGAFEQAELPKNEFDLLTSATAFHWVDPTIGYEKAWECLRPGGTIALFWNEHVEGSKPEPFFDAVQEIYLEVVPERSFRYKGLMRPDKLLELKDYSVEIRASGLFESVQTKTYQWDIAYDSVSYIGLLRTFSDVISMQESKRKELLAKIAQLIDNKFNGKIVKTYLTVLHTGKKSD